MPEDSKDNKAKKLAAARKKLKEYQTKEKRADGSENTAEHNSLPSGTTSATLSEKSDSELNLNGHGLENDLTTPPPERPTNIIVDAAAEVLEAFVTTTEETANTTAAAFFNTNNITTTAFDDINEPSADTALLATPTTHSQQNLNAIQILIAEKAQLTAELGKYRTTCREHDLENEELRTQLMTTTRRLDELQQRYLEQQQAMDEHRTSAADLKQKLTQLNKSSTEQVSHLNELQQQLTRAHSQLQELQQQHKDKCNELELAQIRINQLSDLSCITKDTQVETLTQTQFMYEQQIRDLQAMVQQLTQDKEQANLQYQNYAQHLNAEVCNLNEKNSELSDECTKLQEREQQLVGHISELEREIQRNIARRDQLKEDQTTANVSIPALEAEIAILSEKVSEFDLERHEFQLKIKSQEDRLEAYTKELQQKQLLIEQMQEHLQNISTEQPDKIKLLATMESDKIAASRALTQNVELKKQLDELELRFVQLTNDKADLMNKLDAEEYANREMRSKYTEMEEKLLSIDERFKFKDEEMIRLSHENMDLMRKNLVLQQQVDQLKHYEVREYNERYGKVSETVSIGDCLAQNDNEVSNEGTEQHKHSTGNEHDHDDHTHSNKNCKHEHGDEHDHVHDHHKNKNGGVDEHNHDNSLHSMQDSQTECREEHQPHRIPTTQAVEKLQLRFTKLMTQVADLTDEKQRLEHLVLQLQSETETIGEYIALYQTQRRILKQREYEKAAQMQSLHAEREQMQEKITILNNLVSSLGAELPYNKDIAEHLTSALTTQEQQSVSIDPEMEEHETQQAENVINQKLNSAESQEILTKIQNIITEIKENTKEIPTVAHTVDHFNCCYGKFEVV